MSEHRAEQPEARDSPAWTNLTGRTHAIWPTRIDVRNFGPGAPGREPDARLVDVEPGHRPAGAVRHEARGCVERGCRVVAGEVPDDDRSSPRASRSSISHSSIARPAPQALVGRSRVEAAHLTSAARVVVGARLAAAVADHLVAAAGNDPGGGVYCCRHRLPLSRLLREVEAGQQREQTGIGAPPGLDLDRADRRPICFTGRAECQIGKRIGAGPVHRLRDRGRRDRLRDADHRVACHQSCQLLLAQRLGAGGRRGITR